MAGKEHVDVHVHTRAEAQDVYALLRDGASWPTWTSIDSYQLEQAGAPDGIGAIWIFRRGRVTGRDQIVELIPGRRFDYRHLSGLPVRDYRGEIELKPTEQGTRIGWHVSFTPMISGTGWLLRWAIRRFVQRCADGLAGYAQTAAAREH